MTVVSYIVGGPADTYTGSSIQGAIDALPAAGGVVYLAPGTYEVTQPILVNRPNVSLIGSGPATVISLPATPAGVMPHSLLWVGRMGTGVPLRNITIERIRFKGNQTLGPSGDWKGKPLALADHFDNPGASAIVLHAAVTDELWDWNIPYDEIEQVTIKGCFFESFARYGVFGHNARGDRNGWPYEKRLRYVRVVGNVFRDCLTGAYFGGAEYCSFIGNVGARMQTPTGGGATVYLWGSDKCIVTGNVADTGLYGFIGERTHAMSYVGNCAFGTQRYGLGVEQGQYVATNSSGAVVEAGLGTDRPAVNNVRGNVVGNSGLLTQGVSSDLLEEISIRGFRSADPVKFPTKPETYSIVSGNNLRNNTGTTKQRSAIGELNYNRNESGGVPGAAPTRNLIMRNKITEANDEFFHEVKLAVEDQPQFSAILTSVATKNFTHDETP